MPVLTSLTHGTFGCPGLCSGDANAAKAFYSGLLDWQPDDREEDGHPYTMFKLRDSIVSGMYEMAPARKDAGVRPHWNNYIMVDDVAAVVKRVPELGGKVLMEPYDAMGDLMANLADPWGAKFTVWQARTAQEPFVLMEPGAQVWNELYTPDLKAAEKFYSQLLGWRLGAFEASAHPYTMLTPEKAMYPSGGMMQLGEEMQGMQPQWIPYFSVTDVAGTMSQAKAAGAQVHGPIPVPTVGTLAMMQDPEGAGFAVIQLGCPGGSGAGNSGA